jgi:predicted MPP superfamily phosphohydrolase
MKFMKILTAIAIAIIVFFYIQNIWLQVSRLIYAASTLPQGFNGYRIAQLSDLHCKEFGSRNAILTAKLKRLKPDIIVITGDLINADSFNQGKTLKLMSDLKKIAPVYYVTGNHEMVNPFFPFLEKKLTDSGINILCNSVKKIECKGDRLTLVGIDDSGAAGMDEINYTRKFTSGKLNDLQDYSKDSCFKILLVHRSELFDIYSGNNFDMIFAGHAHGGIGPPGARERPSAGDRQRRALGRLSADRAHRRRRDLRLRGAGAMGSPGSGPDLARQVHSAGRGMRPHPAYRDLGARNRA